MNPTKALLAAVWFTAAALFLLPQFATSQQMPDPTRRDSPEPTPAFHSEAPLDPLPATLAPSLFPEPLVFNAYTVAGRVRKVLYEQPCYCHCDREMGHNSLHSCFEGTHGAACATCMKEAVYSYQQTKLHRSPAQIRAGIERGEWMTVDLDKAAL